MKVLLIGGTGVISTEVTKLCASLGWDVTLLNRGNAAGRLPKDIKIRCIQADINDETAVAEKLNGETFDTVASFVNFLPVQVERDIRLFAGKTKQYILISSAAAYQKSLSGYPITESALLANPFWEYARNKIACEDVLIQAHRRGGFPFTIVRPSHTYDVNSLPVGLHGANGSWQVVKRLMENKPILVQGDGNTFWTLTHSRDFAKGFVGLMGNVRAIGEAVHITSDEYLTWNQVYQAIGNVLNVTPKLVHAASDFIAACDPSLLGPLHGDKSVSAIFDNSKIKSLVPGYKAVIRYDTGIRWSVEHYLSHPEKQKEDPAFDAFTDAVVSELKKAQDAVVNLGLLH